WITLQIIAIHQSMGNPKDGILIEREPCGQFADPQAIGSLIQRFQNIQAPLQRRYTRRRCFHDFSAKDVCPTYVTRHTRITTSNNTVNLNSSRMVFALLIRCDLNPDGPFTWESCAQHLPLCVPAQKVEAEFPAID